MKLIKKIRPYRVDLLVFGFEKRGGLNLRDIKSLSYPLQYDSKTSTYVISHEGMIVHKSKIFHSSNLLRSFGFFGPLMTIGDCFTDELYKGQGIYPAVVSRICAEHIESVSIYMLVSPTNSASIRGIEKAGLKKIARLRCLKVGPFYFNKTKETFQSEL